MISIFVSLFQFSERGEVSDGDVRHHRLLTAGVGTKSKIDPGDLILIRLFQSVSG